jgi:hypothetical protein
MIKPMQERPFQFCAANNSNAVQKEVSAFNYGKLSYELGYMDPALKAFQSFIAAYPKINLSAGSKRVTGKYAGQYQQLQRSASFV